VGLRVATGHNVTGFEEAAVAALAKLEQVMPSHLRHRVDAVHTSTVPIGGRAGPPVDATTIVLVAQACRGLERLRFEVERRRIVAPVAGRLGEVATLRVGGFVDEGAQLGAVVPRGDLRIVAELTGARFVRHDEPGAAVMVTEGIALRAHEEQAVVDLDVPIETALEAIPVSIGVLEPAPEGAGCGSAATSTGWPASSSTCRSPSGSSSRPSCGPSCGRWASGCSAIIGDP
jgi:hypothetical protein